MMPEDTLATPYRAVIRCKEPRLCRLLEIELGLCGVATQQELPADLLLWDLDDFAFEPTALAENRRLLCWSRRSLAEFPQMTDYGDRLCFLRRPFSLTTLEACVRQLSNALCSGLQIRPISLANYTADHVPPLSEKTEKTPEWQLTDDGLRWQDRRISLTPREKSLFERLWREQGTTVSKAELRAVLESDSSDAGEVNTLEVYICHLRRKIEKPIGRRLITTVRGIGYRLENI